MLKVTVPKEPYANVLQNIKVQGNRRFQLQVRLELSTFVGSAIHNFNSLGNCLQFKDCLSSQSRRHRGGEIKRGFSDRARLPACLLAHVEDIPPVTLLPADTRERERQDLCSSIILNGVATTKLLIDLNKDIFSTAVSFFGPSIPFVFLSSPLLPF